MFKRILLATDGSSASEHAASTAIGLARLHGAALTAIYVVDPYPYMGIGEANPMGFGAYIAAAREHAARAHAHVNDLCAQGSPIELELRLIEGVTTLDGILSAAREAKADLIVVGSHGRTGLGRAFLGSVAGKVVAHSSVPVLVVR